MCFHYLQLFLWIRKYMAALVLWTLLHFWEASRKEENVCSSKWSCSEYLLQHIYLISWIHLRINWIPSRAIFYREEKEIFKMRTRLKFYRIILCLLTYMTIHDSFCYRIWRLLSLRTQFHLHNLLTFPQCIFYAP